MRLSRRYCSHCASCTVLGCILRSVVWFLQAIQGFLLLWSDRPYVYSQINSCLHDSWQSQCLPAYEHGILVFGKTRTQGMATHPRHAPNRGHSHFEKAGQHHTSLPEVTAQHSTAQHSTAPQHSTAQHSTAQHSTAQHSTAQHSTVQHNTAPQQSTAQHSTAQHSTEFTKIT